MVERVIRGFWRALAWIDARLNQLVGWRLNPLYQSGSIVVVLFVVIVVTGVYLLLFYRLSSPYASVASLQDQVWLGRWIRAMHRYAADAGVVAIGVHALRMLAERRSWGPRALAWISGLVLTGVFVVSGWTGYVMVWDAHGALLAREGARLLDLVPVFSTPISRTFVGESPLPSAFFFLNLFAHVALPIGMLLILWIHVSRVARPVLAPPRGLTWSLVIALALISVAIPAPLAAPANALSTPEQVPIDVLYSFWLPIAARTGAGVTLALIGVIGLIWLTVPWWSKPTREALPALSSVNERLCTGCEQCYEDCPYEAIEMVERSDGRSGLVARVDPSLCVGCGICAGSCAPMGVGPTGRTGRDQLGAIRAFMESEKVDAGATLILACERSAIAGERFRGCPVYAVSCAGNLHTSVVEYALRAGARGVLIVACPPRDCWNREGSKWLEQRLYHEREAELRERVDRSRIRLVYAAAHAGAMVYAELQDFERQLASAAVVQETAIDILAMCERAEAEVQE